MADESSVPAGKRRLRVAVAGCVHGEIDKVYDTMAELEKDGKGKFELLICCGDYQSIRNYGDLAHMNVPNKYNKIQMFWKYYAGVKKAPVLTVFIGGNHEASGYLMELPNGGWVAPNIYYMGFASVIRFAGLRIGGLSGIYKGDDFHRGHYERPPFPDRGSNISVYHVRSFNIFRCMQLSCPIDIFFSHDWPTGIWNHGDVNRLLQVKPFFEENIRKSKIGIPAAKDLLAHLRPRYWFAAHMHVEFRALVQHLARNKKEEDSETRFLALDKPLPRRHFLESLTMDVDEDAPLHLSYDEEWLAILKNTDHLLRATKDKGYMPSASKKGERWNFKPALDEVAAIRALGDLTIPLNFRQTAPPMKADDSEASGANPTPYYRNPQSSEFCTWLGISDLNKILCDLDPTTVGVPQYLRAESEEELGDVQRDSDQKL